MPLGCVLLTVILSECYETQERKLHWRKIDTEKFWKSDITFLAAPSNRGGLCHFLPLFFVNLLPSVPSGVLFGRALSWLLNWFSTWRKHFEYSGLFAVCSGTFNETWNCLVLRSRKYGKNVSPISTHFPIYFVWKLRIRNASNLIIIIIFFFFLHFIVQCLKICNLSDYMSNDQKVPSIPRKSRATKMRSFYHGKAQDIKVIQNRRKLSTKFYEELRHKTCDCLVEVCFIFCVKFCQTTNTNERHYTRGTSQKKSHFVGFYGCSF